MFTIGLYKKDEKCPVPRKWRICDDVTRVEPYSKELLKDALPDEFAFAQDHACSRIDAFEIDGTRTARMPIF